VVDVMVVQPPGDLRPRVQRPLLLANEVGSHQPPTPQILSVKRVTLLVNFNVSHSRCSNKVLSFCFLSVLASHLNRCSIEVLIKFLGRRRKFCESLSHRILDITSA